tara:strand:- start:2583 stop:3149 length:567 start_codon:yes stop_codon:yes gene_type:complete
MEKESNKKKKKLMETIEIPKGVEVSIDKGLVAVKGPKGENKKNLYNKKVSIKIDTNKVIISSERATKREKKMIGTFKAHIGRMVDGVIKPHKYVLKICSGHFPMTVSVTNNQLVVKNLLGEKIPRVMDIKEGVTVKVEGENISVESTNKEYAGQCAASIEQLTRRTGYDSRIFQDGCYIITKGDKEIK